MRKSAMNLFTLLFVTILSSSVHASPVSPIQKRDVFTPPITYPTNTTVWNKERCIMLLVGPDSTRCRDISGAPVNITNRFGGRIQLRAGGLTTPLILADSFDVLLGTYPVTVPWVISGDDFQLVFFGDSGDFSAEFTINGVPE
ncbi:hypothetical protein BT96DRAFT_972372 [Gymnopus androsaceus JB14]|uniref:Uncharacterized protein n=1 Tax=Gymnopus androsaceus JB14 TaxID=1447944 RepID=A0A6A4I6Z1_9AGAR|nr:hypothetical protein BT96DRAFT_972372 [Gymnopus androsaceus JB14]